MMKLFCIFFLGISFVSFAQERVKKTIFADFPTEEILSKEYNILELRHYQILDNTDYHDSVLIQGKKYKLFPTRNDALAYYYTIKKIAKKREIYYIIKMEKNKKECFPFRIED